MDSSRFVITVIGEDKVGIVAGITKILAQFHVNVVDINQTILNNLFTMIMLAEIKEEDFDLSAFQQAIEKEGHALSVDVKVQHENAFRFMHRI